MSKLLDKEFILPVDIDSTLIERPHLSEKYIEIKCPYDGIMQKRIIMFRNLKLVKDKHARGYTIIAWSAAGGKWAEAVCKAIGLDDYVTMYMSKPSAYIDDLPVEQWMPYRIYLKD